jgi:hypothetical protein
MASYVQIEIQMIKQKILMGKSYSVENPGKIMGPNCDIACY